MDDLRRQGLNFIGIQITGGSIVTEIGKDYNVPKQDLISALQVIVQSERLKISKELEHAMVLKQEMLNFRVKVNDRTGHEQYWKW